MDHARVLPALVYSQGIQGADMRSDKILIVTDSHTEPESHSTPVNNIKDIGGSFVENPIEGAISRHEFESRSAVLKKATEISL